MYAIDNDTASTTLPPIKPVGIPGFFTAGTVGGVPATIVEADWLNQVQQELLAILQAASIAPSKQVNTQVIQAILWLIANNTRQRLTGPLNLYVNASTGNDGNNGLTPTTAFATPQAAWNYIMARLDIGAQSVTVNLADGTYPGFGCAGAPVGQESWQVVFTGDAVNPTAVVISGLNQGAITVSSGAIIVFKNMRLQSSGSGFTAGIGLYVTTGGIVQFENIDFAACSDTHLSVQNGEVAAQGLPYTISGNAPYHINCAFAGSLDLAGVQVTLYNSPNWTGAFINMEVNAVTNLGGAVFNGPAVGKRYQLSTNAVLMLNGADPDTFLPGNAAGTVTTGAQIV